MNDVINHCAHLLTDMGKLRCPPLESIKKEGFAKFSKLFCDSIVFWCLYNVDSVAVGAAIGRYIAEIRDIFSRISLDVASIKSVQRGIITGDEYFSDEIMESHREEYGDGPYTPGYVAIKVALDDTSAKEVVPLLTNILRSMRKRHIVLHDIDFAHDCKYISTRAHMQSHLEDNGITEVIDDRRKVGDYCISWRGKKKKKNIRYKVYNKFVQLLESAEVRKSLGSRMEQIVSRDGKFAKRLKRYKKYGYTRIELTFYGPNLLSLSEYKSRMEETKDLLDDCPTFKCSFEKQWQQRAKHIKSMLVVYFPEKRFFAYCHWWNSITSKKYGYMWTNVSINTVPQLVANYSFNDRPAYYVEATIGSNGNLTIGLEKAYQRVPGCTAMTMVAGGAKGMFPSIESFENGVREFSDMGIIEVDNITIGWPERKHDGRSVPVAEIIEKEDERVGYVRRLSSINTSAYTTAHGVLRRNSEYTIVAAGLKEYRGHIQWHFITECGLHVRAGKWLTSVWDEWKRTFENYEGYLDSITSVKWMKFIALTTVKSRGKTDIKCVLAL